MTTDHKKKIAVLMAAFNGAAWIEEQIQSILCQELVDLTLFISVDLSMDGTEKIVDHIARLDDRVIILAHGRKFGGAGPNFFRLFKEVDFELFDYVALSDQDDIWEPNKLRRALEVIKHEAADAYSSNVTAFWPSGKTVLINKSQPQVLFDYLFESAGPGCTYVLSKALAKEIKSALTLGQEVNLIELHDWFIYAFARSKDYRWVIDDFSGVMYRQHEANQIGVNYGLKAFFCRARKVLSGWWLSQSYLIARAIGMEDHPFVLSWSSGHKIGYLKLLIRAFSCRRRLRDKFLFAIACLLIALK